MNDYHIVLGVVSSIIGFSSFFPYFRDILRGTTKPHPFTYFIWGLINAIAFFAQISAGGGPGSWVSGVVTLECLAVALLALRWGEKDITKLDWLCLMGAFMGIVLWRITNEPLTAIVFVTITDGLAAIPTFRKSYWKPDEETASSYVLGALRSLIALPALTIFNFTTALYPAFVALVDIALVALLLVRRKQLKSTV